MANHSILEKPYRPEADRSFGLLLFNLLFPITGVLFLKWDLFAILYLFWIEFIFLGVITLLKMLFALGNANFITGLLPKLFTMVGFGVLYTGLLMIVLSYSFVSFDFDHYLDSYNYKMGLGVGLILLVTSMFADFIFHFVLSKKYKRVHYMEPLFRTMMYALPLGCAVVFAILPLAERYEGQNRNVLVIIGIIVAKSVVEYILVFGSRFLKSNTNPAA